MTDATAGVDGTRVKRRALPLDLRVDVWDESGGRCHYCQEALHPLRNFTVDHVIPVARGGSNDRSNLVAACRRCNISKGAGIAPGVPAVAPGELTVEQIADRLQVNAYTVRRWLRGGDLAGTAGSGRTGWRVSEEAVTAFLQARRSMRGVDEQQTGQPMTLQEWRNRRVLSTGELAARAGISKVTVIAIENGHVQRIQQRTMRRVAEALGVDPWSVAEFRRALSGDAPADED
jgi:excisionase family DNA binding protein